MMLLISSQYGAKKSTAALIDAARVHGIQTDILLNSYNHIDTNQLLGFYGEHAFCEFLAQEFRYNLYQNSPDWVTRLSHDFVQRSVCCLPLEKVIEIENSNKSILDTKILEPADDPCFDTKIYSERFPRVPLKTPVLVSTAHSYIVKHRFVINNRRITAKCCYFVQPTLDDKILFNKPVIHDTVYENNGITVDAFVKTLLSHNNVAPACVIDVGFIREVNKWAVCNTYPIWTAEPYGCNPHQFLDAIFVGCQKIKARISA